MAVLAAREPARLPDVEIKSCCSFPASPVPLANEYLRYIDTGHPPTIEGIEQILLMLVYRLAEFLIGDHL
jgi:hypothetical protein